MGLRVKRAPGASGRCWRARWWLIIPVTVLASVAAFELRVASQEAIIEFVCAEYNNHSSSDHDGCEGSAVSTEASFWIKWINVGNGIGAIAAAGLGGALSDRYGRRPVLMASLAGYLLIAVVSALLCTIPSFAEFWRPALVTVWVLGGAMGGTGMLVMNTFAYTADLVTEKSRGIAFAAMESAFGLGGMIGYLGGGYIAKILGAADVFWVVAGVLVAVLVYMAVLPESLAHNLRSDSVPLYKANSLYCLHVLFGRPSATRPRKQWALLLLSMAFALSFLSEMGVSSISTLFLSAKPLRWDDVQVGTFNAVNAAARSASAVLALPLLARVVSWERHELWVAGISLLLYGSSIELVGALSSELAILVAVAASGLAIPVAFGFMRCAFSRSVDAMHQGQMLAALAFLESLCIVLGPLVFNTLYEATTGRDGSLRSLCWYIIGGLNVVAAALLMPVPPIRPGATEWPRGRETDRLLSVQHEETT